MKTTGVFLLVCIQCLCLADTITHKQKEIVYHGYAKQSITDGFQTVITLEKGPLQINPADYTIEYDDSGRNNTAAVISIIGGIDYDHEASAFEEAILVEADKGPLFILIEIDTPGGRVDLARRICAAIMKLQYCPTIAYIKGGEQGGAISAGAAISLACDKIYMSPETSIGGATMISTRSGKVVDMKKAYGETVGEKYDSVWRTYLASLAQENNRPGALAMAMADKDIVVVEVDREGQPFFVEPKDKLNGDVEVRTVCSKGQLLTLTADDAVKCQIANGIVSSRQDLLAQLGHAQAQAFESTVILEAKEEFEKVVRRCNKIGETLDLEYKELISKSKYGSLTRGQALKNFQKIVNNAEYLLRMKQRYPYIPFDEDELVEFLNSAKAEYEAIRAIR